MTFLQFTGARPSCPVSQHSRMSAFLPFFILVAWCSFSVSCGQQVPTARILVVPLRPPPTEGAHNASSYVSRQYQAGNLREVMGGGPAMGRRPNFQNYSSKNQGIINQAAIRHSTDPGIRAATGRRFFSIGLDSGVGANPYQKQLYNDAAPIRHESYTRYHSECPFIHHAKHVNARAIHPGCQTDHNTGYYNKNGVELLPYSFCTGPSRVSAWS